jgi:hypothetical protein
MIEIFFQFITLVFFNIFKISKNKLVLNSKGEQKDFERIYSILEKIDANALEYF